MEEELQISVQMTVITINNYVPDTVLSVLFMISLNEVLFIPILQKKKLRLRG